MSRSGHARSRKSRRGLGAVLAVAALAAGGVTAVALLGNAASAAEGCNAFTSPVHQLVNPSTGAQLLTLSANEAATARTKYHFTDDRGTPFAVGTSASSQTHQVRRMYNAKGADFVWIQTGAEHDKAISKYGYHDEGDGAAFQAFDHPAPGCVPVYRFLKGTKHRTAITDAERTALTAAGWRQETIAFYAKPTAAPPPTDTGAFSFAVMPDTQNLTTVTHGNVLFDAQTQWLVDHRGANDLNLKWVQHTGDVVNWGWLVPQQLQVASHAIGKLEAAGLPYSLSVGNHDTRAVGWDGKPGSTGYGGSAYVGNPECVQRLGASECNTLKLVRHTEEFNATFKSSRYGNVGGVYQQGKVDNLWTSYTAGGHKWLVLTLELWPRTEVINWAKQVVSSHPDYNVIVQTHSFLNADGSIMQNNGGYGANSPQTLWDQLISQYSNIKMVFSGHVGNGTQKTYQGVHGNTVYTFLECYHASDTNPTRLVKVDPAAGTIDTRVYAPATNQTYSDGQAHYSGVAFV